MYVDCRHQLGCVFIPSKAPPDWALHTFVGFVKVVELREIESQCTCCGEDVSFLKLTQIAFIVEREWLFTVCIIHLIDEHISTSET